MKFDVLTLFPEMFKALDASMIGRAAREGIISLDVRNIRDYSRDKRKRTDDTPFGGGPGMLMTAQPIDDALKDLEAERKPVLYLSPRGDVMDQKLLEEIAAEEEIVLLAGHYEGVDQRILDKWNIKEVSIGDYILTGGELPAMVLIDAVTRLLPGVLASRDSALEESVYSGLLEYPQYTQPRNYEGMEVPEILLSGDHRKIHLWRLEQALILTKKKRPEMFEEFVKNPGGFAKDEQKVIEKVRHLL